MKPSNELIAALKSIHYDPWNLMGRSNCHRRQVLMRLITGEQRPLTQCGVNALGRELEARWPHRAAASCAARWPQQLEETINAANNS